VLTINPVINSVNNDYSIFTSLTIDNILNRYYITDIMNNLINVIEFNGYPAPRQSNVFINNTFTNPVNIIINSTSSKGFILENNNNHNIKYFKSPATINACSLNPSPCNYYHGQCINNETIISGYMCDCNLPYYSGI